MIYVISWNVAYWVSMLLLLSLAFEIIPNIAPFMVLSTIGIGVYISKITVEIICRN